MATATVTLVLPATRTDAAGTPFTAADYGGAHVFRDGTKLGTITAPGLTFTDADLSPGTYVYSASVFDTQVPAVEGELGSASPVTVAAPLAAPGTPTVTVTVA